MSDFLRHFVPKYISKKYLKQFSTQRLDIVQNVLIPSSLKISQGAKHPNTLKLYTTIRIENVYLDKASITSSVPQGSVLGPLLFLIYINDIQQAMESEPLLYADDTCLVFQHKAKKQ